MIVWLADTLLMTGAIMALILLVRRPVGRWFGPGAAYALWALPMIRLLLPPLVLPGAVNASRAAEALVRPVTAPVTQAASATMPVRVIVETVAAPAATAAPAFSLADLPWQAILVSVWLGGAALFLALRALAYRRMRQELLRGARVIGSSGRVRIVESFAADAPVAFGVFDRVVALPQGFLAHADSDTSDFAITHELEHHAGNDLIANIAVQPLFALHWFNPIGWLAWRALRSDQEAACDARVMSGRTRQERERYGRLIASFAAGQRFALAAPMAGPLKGDKPIVHRLKALVRNDVPERHRLVGRSLFAASVIAVPLTATVTYAAVEVPEAPAAPEAPQPPEAVQAPEGAEAPEAPLAPADAAAAPPATPEAARPLAGHRLTVAERRMTRSDAYDDRADADEDRADAEADRAEEDADRAEAEADRAQANADRLAAEAERTARDALRRAPKVEQTMSADGKIQTIRIVSRDGQGPVVRKMVIDASCPADRQPVARAAANRAIVESRVCTGTPDVSRQVTMALRSARASIAANTAMPASDRAKVLADFDRGIAEAAAERN